MNFIYYEWPEKCGEVLMKKKYGTQYLQQLCMHDVILFDFSFLIGFWNEWWVAGILLKWFLIEIEK